jgi:hypothetical protein
MLMTKANLAQSPFALSGNCRIADLFVDTKGNVQHILAAGGLSN